MCTLSTQLLLCLQKEEPGKGRAEEKEGRRGESETRVRNRGASVALELHVPHNITPFVPHSPQVSSALFFQYNTQLGPPYHVLVDTNFINFSIQNKLDIVQSMMDCLFAKCEQLDRGSFVILMTFVNAFKYHQTFM